MFGDTAVYNIRINSGEQTGNSSKPQDIAKPNAQDPTKPSKSPVKSTTAAVGLYVGKQIFSYVSSNVEAYTRNAQLQEQINTGMKAIGYGVAIVANPALGIAALAFDVASQALTYAKKTTESNLVSEQYRKRSGNYNRSRE